jgi:septum formation protein
MHKTIILASRSPRRVELLKQIHIDCKSMPADIDETPLLNEQPEDYVLRLAQQKAASVAQMVPTEFAALPILAADTTVAINGEILGKPENDAKFIWQIAPRIYSSSGALFGRDTSAFK